MSAALAVPQPAPPNPRVAVGLDLTEGSPRELMLLLNTARRGHNLISGEGICVLTNCQIMSILTQHKKAR